MNDFSKNEKTDQALVHDALLNPDLFALIVNRYQMQLRRYIVRLGCRNGEDIDDVLQDIFIKVYINLNEYDTDLKFSSWLYRIAHNETVSFFRKKNVRPMPVTTEEELKLFENLADRDDFVKFLNEKMNADILREVLTKLEEQYRDVLVLRFLEEKNYNEISDILKIPEGTVGTLLNRGKKRLKEILITRNINL